MQDKKTQFFNQMTIMFKQHIDESTTIASLGGAFDSLSRSEIVFAIEDIWGVDLWGVKLQSMKDFNEIIKMVESKL